MPRRILSRPVAVVLFLASAVAPLAAQPSAAATPRVTIGAGTLEGSIVRDTSSFVKNTVVHVELEPEGMRRRGPSGERRQRGLWGLAVTPRVA